MNLKKLKIPSFQKTIDFIKENPAAFTLLLLVLLVILAIFLISSSVPDWSLESDFENKEYKDYEELRVAIEKLINSDLGLPFIFIRTKKELDIDIWKAIINGGYKIYSTRKSLSLYFYYFVENGTERRP